ncbi:hypothetical protein [Pseudomonas sp. ADAK13]|uniref:hypothetical protein n=1 Tax=Pseudomonas sp. ADAK13 TaxID=2730847 RepID=UPI00146465A5|nr:hypothetical protein [Pseudomonas sp. ADAK13]QJI38622.1 hypothetical protein HKK54_30910 [Pseudomonas sp. ADAK13]
MIDNLTRQLLTKYLPSDPRLQQEPLQAPTAITKSEALPSQAPATKSPSGAATDMLVVMDSREYSEDTILKAVVDFNREHPKYMSHSFTLPIAINGIAAGSWVITDIEDI